jgi:hypothetical protein
MTVVNEKITYICIVFLKKLGRFAGKWCFFFTGDICWVCIGCEWVDWMAMTWMVVTIFLSSKYETWVWEEKQHPLAEKLVQVEAAFLMVLTTGAWMSSIFQKHILICMGVFCLCQLSCEVLLNCLFFLMGLGNGNGKQRIMANLY